MCEFARLSLLSFSCTDNKVISNIGSSVAAIAINKFFNFNSCETTGKFLENNMHLKIPVPGPFHSK
jgi:hypothetical protein